MFFFLTKHKYTYKIKKIKVKLKDGFVSTHNSIVYFVCVHKKFRLVLYPQDFHSFVSYQNSIRYHASRLFHIIMLSYLRIYS